MILLYHKIDTDNPTVWWVTADKFYRQLVQLRHKKVVYLDEYDPNNPDHVVITFDGIYSNVLRYAAPLLKKFGYPFELFITSDYVGKGNEFDSVEPPCPFAGENELKELMKMGGRLQWHTKTHRDITTLSDEEVEQEILVPAHLKKLDKDGFTWFAYAYGRFDARSQALVKKHFTGGLACENGTFKDKTVWPRNIINEDTTLIKEKVSVLIPCYNYGRFLVEAIESVLRQTYLPDEIILSDDASTDHSYDIMKVYKDKYPDLIKINHNAKNMGIDKHFNKIVDQAKGDFICLIGADNRIPSNYVEESVATLLANDKVAVAYTDFALFGSRAKELYDKFDSVNKKFKGAKLGSETYLIHYPEFNKASKEYLLNENNFIHGSSMYRAKVYKAVGGYSGRSKEAEDYALFKAMIKKGWDAKKVPNIYLEYRQHSVEQANNQFSLFGELAFLRDQFKSWQQKVSEYQDAIQRQQDHIASLDSEIAALRNQLHEIHSSKAWKVAARSRRLKFLARHPRYTSRKIASKIKRSK